MLSVAKIFGDVRYFGNIRAFLEHGVPNAFLIARAPVQLAERVA
jgi:hypothetical protein